MVTVKHLLTAVGQRLDAQTVMGAGVSAERAVMMMYIRVLGRFKLGNWLASSTR